MTLLDRTWTPGTGDGASRTSEQAGQEARQGTQAGTSSLMQQNVGGGERAVSLAAGSILGLLGLARGDVTGLLIAGVGGAMIYRGATGNCMLYTALGVNTATDEGASSSGDGSSRLAERLEKRGTHVVVSFLINKSPEELYAYWRDLTNLPKIMRHLESVTVLDEKRSHWVAKAPSVAGGKVEWDAEIVRDDANARIDWRSLPGADVDNVGSVQFTPALGDRGTMVRVSVDYVPPAGVLGRMVAKLFGKEPEQEIREDLRAFKRVMELGEAPTIIGQPHGTCTGQGKYYTETGS